MKAKKFLVISMLVVLVGLVAGCHESSVDGYRGYSNNYYGSNRYGSNRYGSNRYGSYREGFRDGRVYERRRDDWRDSRYDYYRGRW